MNDCSEVSVFGVLLPEFLPREQGFSLENFMRSFLSRDDVSKGAKDFLCSASPSRARTDWSESTLVMVRGDEFEKDPHTEQIRRFARNKSWSTPSFEDALRLFSTIETSNFGPNIEDIIVLHNPVKNVVLGLKLEQRGFILSAYKTESRKKGWNRGKLGFIFRTD